MTRPGSPWRPWQAVPRPPTWLTVAGWALAGLLWLTHATATWFVALGVFAALTVWWGVWLAQRGRP